MSERPSPFQYPLSVDPYRLLLALRDRWLAVLLIILSCSVAGIHFGRQRYLKPRFTATAMLQKTPDAEGAGAYRDQDAPEMLHDQALLTLALGPKILDPLGGKIDPARSIQELREVLTIVHEPLQEIYVLSSAAPSEEEAVRLVNLWSRDVIDFTTAMQRRHAQVRERQLQQNLARLNEKLRPIDAQIERLARQESVVDDPASTAAIFADIQALETQLRSYRIDRETYAQRKRRAVEALMELHPVRAQYHEEIRNLTQLRTHYTEKNELLIKQKEIIDTLRADIEEQLQGEPTEAQLQACLQTRGGETLYQNYMDLRNEELEIEQGMETVEEALAGKRAELKRRPGISSRFNALNDQREALVAQVHHVQTRLNAAEFYATTTPGYLRLFQEALPGLSSVATGSGKAVAAAIAAALAGIALAFSYAFARELCAPEMRTMLQAAITTGARPRFWTTPRDDLEEESRMREFWLTDILGREGRGQRILFPIVASLKAEFSFWKSLLQCIGKDHARVLFIDVAQEPAPESFLKANLLPFAPPRDRRESLPNFLDDAGEDCWQLAAAEDGAAATITATGPSATALAILPQALRAEPGHPQDDQPMIPYHSDVSESARYVSAADYSARQLSQLLQDLPPHYYVLCRWGIGPSSSLAAISGHFDKHYLMTTPQASPRGTAAAQSRIFRRILDVPDGLILLNEPGGNVVCRLVNRLQARFFSRGNRHQSAGIPAQ